MWGERDIGRVNTARKREKEMERIEEEKERKKEWKTETDFL